MTHVEGSTTSAAYVSERVVPPTPVEPAHPPAKSSSGRKPAALDTDVLLGQLLGPDTNSGNSHTVLDDQQLDAADFLGQLMNPVIPKKDKRKVEPNRALYDAAWEGDFEAAFNALEKKADPTKGFGPRNNTALHVSARTGFGAILGMLLKKGVSTELRNASEETPLFGAVRESNVAATQALIDAGADVNARDNTGRTVLAIAREKQLLDFVEFLVSCGATD